MHGMLEQLGRYARVLAHRSLWWGRWVLAASLFCVFWICTFIPVTAESSNPQVVLPELPDGFVHEQIFAGLIAPIDMAILPSGDILIIEKGLGRADSTPANVYILHEPDSEALLEHLMTLDVNAIGDSGLLSLLLDPNFGQNQHFYLWYTTPGSAFEWTTDGSSKSRLTRFTLDTTSWAIDRSLESVVIDNIPHAYYHGGGGIAFNNQGELFIATGDAWDDQWDSHVSQNLRSPLGKVLRIRPTESGYVVPQDNPFLGRSDVLPEIYASGLRNPFRMTHRAADDAIFIGDVGWDVWEELNMLHAGANYGWPIREGPCPLGQRLPCDNAFDYSDPVMFYEHPPGIQCCQGGAITGMAFYEGTTFPREYHNQLFVADYNHQFIAAIDPADSLHYDGPHFGENIGALTDIEYFDERLYLLDVANGSVSRISYYGDDSPPVAVLTADPGVGAAPLTVRLDGADSTSTIGVPLTYEWHLNDGSASTTTESPLLEHTFTLDGDYGVELVVIDSEMRRSMTATLPVHVYSGPLPEIEILHSDSNSRTLFRGGDEFVFKAKRAWWLNGLKLEQPFTWDLALHHNQHVHPLIANASGLTSTISIPQKNHGGIDIWYEIGLTMHTSSGQSIRVTEELRPEYSQVSIRTEPPISGTLTLDGRPLAFPNTLEMITNVAYTVELPERITTGSRIYQFETWVGANGQNEIDTALSRAVIPLSAAESLTAIYIELDQKTYIPILR